MVCSKCGAVLKKGKVYCSRCGQEAQIVSDVHILEDDLLREMMDDQDPQEVKERGRSSSGNKKKKDGNRKRETKKKQKKIRRNLIVCIVVLAAAAAAVLGIIKYNQNHSVGYLMKKAGEANSQKDYKTALDYLDRVLLLDEDNAAALLMAGEINTAMKDYDTAEKQLLTVLEMGGAPSPEAYQYLITIYEAQGQKGKILALAEDISDEEILALFEDYIVPVPEIDMESGVYSEFFTVEITAPKRNLKIYYTLDGTTPTKEDTLYEEPIEISEQGEIVLSAVCMDKEGNYSETVAAEYEVELDIPDMPRVSPDGGQFSTPVTVTVTVPKGAEVYYTWDGSAPGKGSSKYTGPIDVPEGNNILSLVAIGSNGMKSEVLKCNYIYYPEDDSRNDPEETE